MKNMNSKILLAFFLKTYLTHFMALVSKVPEIHQKTKGFLMFSGGIERDQCHGMGSEFF